MGGGEGEMWRQQCGRQKRERGGGCSTNERACRKDLPLLRVVVVYLEDGGDGDAVQRHHWVGL